MATLVIGNTYCGGGRGHGRVADLAARVGGDVVLATRAGHAEALARQAAGRYARVIAAGGDGTAHEVANGLLTLPVGQRPTLGLLPLGTGNDIARNLGLLTVDAALAAIEAGSTRGLDVFRVDCHDALGRPLRVHGLLNCGIGYGAEVVLRTTQRVKRLAGPALGYLWGTLSALVAWDSPSMTLAGDFGCWRGRAFFASLCNGELECGGSLRMAPGASMTDGTAHLVLVRRAARPLLAGKLALLSSGGHIGQPQVSYLPTTWLQVGAQRPLGLQCDGDVVGFSPCRIALLAHALEVLAP